MNADNQQDGADRQIWIGPYVVEYVDVLNQKEKLRSLNKLPQNEDERKQSIAGLKETVGVVDLFRDCFTASFDSVQEDLEGDLPRLTEEQNEKFRGLLKTDIHRFHFSDTMVFYTRVDPQSQYVPIRSIQVMLVSSAAVFLTALSNRLICRGGIEAGVAGEFFGDLPYGPGLYHAYQLESTVAQYPRIVVGPSLCELIRQEATQKNQSTTGRFRRSCGELTRDLLCRDIDGSMILDYLGKGIRDIFDDLGDEIDTAESFVLSEWERFKRARNYKLAHRYFCLANYIQQRKREFWT